MIKPIEHELFVPRALNATSRLFISRESLFYWSEPIMVWNVTIKGWIEM
jgi:hypothetical protein